METMRTAGALPPELAGYVEEKMADKRDVRERAGPASGPRGPVSPALLLSLHSHSDPLMGFLQFLSISCFSALSFIRYGEPVWSSRLYHLSGLHVLSFFSRLPSAAFLLEGLTAPEISSACLVHLFGFLSSDLISSLSPPHCYFWTSVFYEACAL